MTSISCVLNLAIIQFGNSYSFSKKKFTNLHLFVFVNFRYKLSSVCVIHFICAFLKPQSSLSTTIPIIIKWPCDKIRIFISSYISSNSSASRNSSPTHLLITLSDSNGITIKIAVALMIYWRWRRQQLRPINAPHIWSPTQESVNRQYYYVLYYHFL